MEFSTDIVGLEQAVSSDQCDEGRGQRCIMLGLRAVAISHSFMSVEIIFSTFLTLFSYCQVFIFSNFNTFASFYIFKLLIYFMFLISSVFLSYDNTFNFSEFMQHVVT